MIVKDLIEGLKDLNPESEVLLFDEEAIPYYISSIVHGEVGKDLGMDYINIEHVELT